MKKLLGIIIIGFYRITRTTTRTFGDVSRFCSK